MPVHHWCKRHLFRPFLVKYKLHPLLAVALVFTWSALMHEILIGIPIHSVNGFAFCAMMLQIPMILIDLGMKKLRRAVGLSNDMLFDTIGNLSFWLSFTIVGQPMCAVLYYYFAKHG